MARNKLDSVTKAQIYINGPTVSLTWLIGSERNKILRKSSVWISRQYPREHGKENIILLKGSTLEIFEQKQYLDRKNNKSDQLPSIKSIKYLSNK